MRHICNAPCCARIDLIALLHLEYDLPDFRGYGPFLAAPRRKMIFLMTLTNSWRTRTIWLWISAFIGYVSRLFPSGSFTEVRSAQACTGLILAFFHAIKDKDASQNNDITKRHEEWSNYCGTAAISEEVCPQSISRYTRSLIFFTGHRIYLARRFQQHPSPIPYWSSTTT